MLGVSARLELMISTPASASLRRLRCSPPGAEVLIRIWREADGLRVDLVDQALGFHA